MRKSKIPHFIVIQWNSIEIPPYELIKKLSKIAHENCSLSLSNFDSVRVKGKSVSSKFPTKIYNLSVNLTHFFSNPPGDILFVPVDTVRLT